MEEKVKMSILCEIYGKLLTEKQYEILNDYYNNDYSISEIAENNQITRQAVKDVINKANNKLNEYEEKLLFMKKTINQQAIVNDVIAELSKTKNEELTDQNIKNIVKKLKKIVED